MSYFKGENKKVYAYDDEQMVQVDLIKALESKLSRLDRESEEFEQVSSELSSIPSVFFDIRDNINSMHKMTEKEVDAHLNPSISKEQLIAEAEAKKQSLLAEATNAIAPLQDAVDLDMATNEEAESLKEWKKYRVLLNRVDTSTTPDIEWLEKNQLSKPRG